ncbi:MAG: DUF4124 domain-containing protein [Desulfobacterales bacterium]|nr:MAG: DUF4124 domain-containing protein [Desulfobacterales bacterium]
MNTIRILSIIVLVGLWITNLNADIYTWTDKNGVKHFSNQPPANAGDATVIFREYQFDAAAHEKRVELEQQEWQTLIQDIEREEKRAQEEARRKAEEARKNQPPTRDELISSEKDRLEKKIAELEDKPLDYFGSFKNKRVRLGYYRYRLQTLMESPDDYFNHPEKFEGNIKYPDDANSTD